MLKSPLLVTIIISIISYINATVTLNFIQAHFVLHTPTQFQFTTTEENINGMKFTPTTLDSTTKPDIWKFYPHNDQINPNYYSLYGLNLQDSDGTTRAPCINGHTQQRLGYLQFDPTNTFFTFHIDDDNVDVWTSIYTSENKYGGEWNIICILYVKQLIDMDKLSTTINYQWNNNINGSTNLLPPINNWIQPIINITSVTTYLDSEYLRFGNGHITIEFFTNTIGIYNIIGIEGPQLNIDPEGYNLPWSCSIDTKEQYGHIEYVDTSNHQSTLPHTTNTNLARIYINELTTELITCQIGIQFGPARYHPRIEIEYDNGNNNIYTIAEVNNDYDLYNGGPRSYGEFHNVLPYNYTIKTIFIDHRGFSYDSEISIFFAYHFNVKNLLHVNDTIYEPYHYCDVELMATVQLVNNTVILQKPQINMDLSLFDRSILSCTFYFANNDTEIFDYDVMMYAQYGASINNKNVHDYYRPTSEQIHFLSSSQLGLSTLNMTQNEDNNIIIIEHEFALVDQSNIHNIPTIQPQILFTFQEPYLVPTTYEKYGDYLECASKSSGQFWPFDLTFNTTTLIWSYNVIEMHEVTKYNLTIKCTHNVPKLNKYGFDLIPRLTLIATLIDRDSKNYIHSLTTTTSTMNIHIQPTERPEGAMIPSSDELESRIMVKQFFTIPTNNNYSFQSILSQSQQYSTDVYDIIINNAQDYEFDMNKSKLLQYQLQPILSPTRTDSKYSNFQSSEKLQTFYTEITGVLNDQFDYLSVGNTVISQNFHYQHFNPMIVLFQQYYYITKVGNSESIQKVKDAIYQHQITLVNNDSNYIPDLNPVQVLLEQSTPISKCGYIDGFALQGNKDSDFTVWDTILKAEKIQILCQIGESCTINNDCDQPAIDFGVSLCIKGKCTFKHYVQSPYQYYSTSSQLIPIFSLIWTIVLVSLAI